MVAESFQLKNYVFKQNQKMVQEEEIVKISGKQEAEEGGKQEMSLSVGLKLPSSLRRWRKCRGTQGDTEQL